MAISTWRLSGFAVLIAILLAGIAGPGHAEGKNPFANKLKPLPIKPLVQPKEEACGEFGTSIEFADSPIAAAKQALKDEKLVFVLHVSGNFETPDFT